MCRFIDSEWALLGCVGLPGNEEHMVGLYLCRCCLSDSRCSFLRLS